MLLNSNRPLLKGCFIIELSGNPMFDLFEKRKSCSPKPVAPFTCPPDILGIGNRRRQTYGQTFPASSHCFCPPVLVFLDKNIWHHFDESRILARQIMHKIDACVDTFHNNSWIWIGIGIGGTGMERDGMA